MKHERRERDAKRSTDEAPTRDKQQDNTYRRARSCKRAPHRHIRIVKDMQPKAVGEKQF
jgi:hypothetical protein